MTEEKATPLMTPVREMTEEEKEQQRKREAIAGTEKSVLMLKRIHDLLTVGLFQGANANYLVDGLRFVRHLVDQAEEELKTLKPEAPEGGEGPKA
jgi:hypothetical protein